MFATCGISYRLLRLQIHVIHSAVVICLLSINVVVARSFENERKERKKHREEQETIKSLQSSITSQTRYLASLMEHKKTDSDDCKIKETNERLAEYQQRLKEINRMKIFDHDFQDDLSS